MPFFIWLLLLFTFIEQTLRGQEAKTEMVQGFSNTFLEQCFSGIRVIQTFAMSKPLLKHWDTTMLKHIERLQRFPTLVRSIKIAWCQFAFCSILAAGYYYGTTLKEEGFLFGSIFNVSLISLTLQRSGSISSRVTGAKLTTHEFHVCENGFVVQASCRRSGCA